MNDRELLELATTILNEDEFRVWFAKHYNGNGRRTGSLTLGITPEAWRHRLTKADLKIAAALDKETAA